jgi:hypothetical protein
MDEKMMEPLRSPASASFRAGDRQGFETNGRSPQQARSAGNIIPQ